MSGLQLADGKGSGSLMEVKNNRAKIDADVHQALHEHAEKGNAYVWTMATYSFSNADTVLAIRNTSATDNLHITKIVFSSQTTGIAAIHRVDGSAALAGTAVTGVNLNGASGNVADADAKADETTNTSQGTIIQNFDITVALTTYTVDFDSALVLGTNQMIGIDMDTAGTSVQCSIYGFFDSES